MVKLTLTISKFVPTILWRMSDEQVYLTFDDGPDQETTPILINMLQKFGIQATFFVLGQKAERHPEIVSRLKQSGHTIGNHSYCHPKMLWKNRKQIYDEIKYTDDILFKITGVRPTLFRPPYGRVGWQLLNVIKFTQHKIVLWSASTRDYRMRANPNTIQSKFNRCLRPGNIVLLHDGHRNSHNTLKGLEFSLAELKHRNIKFSALPNSKTMEFRL